MQGQVVVVTGGARGIGRAVAEEAAERGATVVVSARSTAASPNKVLSGTLDEVASGITARGGAVVPVAADLSTDEGVQALVAAVQDQLDGRVDVLVNGAALSFVGPFLEVPARRWRPVYAVNLQAPVALTQAFLPGMLARGAGAVLNLTTGAAEPDSPVPELAYASSKLALEHVGTALQREIDGRGVGIYCVRIDEVIPTEAVAYAAPQLLVDARYDAAGFARAALDLLARPDDAGRVLIMEDLVERGLLKPA